MDYDVSVVKSTFKKMMVIGQLRPGKQAKTTLKRVSNICSVSQDADFSIILNWSISLTTAVQM